MAGDLKKDAELEVEDKKAPPKEGSDDKSAPEEHGEETEDKRVTEERDEAAELEAAEDDAEREKIRERRREERRFKKARRHNAEVRTKGELAAAQTRIRELENRLSNLETRGTQGELAQVDAAIRQGQDLLNQARRARLDAQREGNWERAELLDDQIYKARRYVEDMASFKKKAEQESAAPQPMNSAMASLANSWIEENSSWYQPKGRDEDSRITRAISDGLVEDGFDPATPRYWDELTSRVKGRLPHRFESKRRSLDDDDRDGDRDRNNDRDDDDREERSRPRSVGGSGRRSTGSSSQAGDFRLSRERVEALKEAGYQPGTKEYKSMIDDYKRWDRERDERRSA